MRREPAIIMCLLNKGANVSQLTADGRSAIGICRRLTRLKDYNTKMEQGQESNKDRLCIDILEREMMRNPMAVEDAVTSPLLADDLHMKLLYLENRGEVDTMLDIVALIGCPWPPSNFQNLKAGRSGGLIQASL
jgi:regulatory protein NPR1